ncbi:MAG: hypothetical protein HRU09_20220 [Oligoflexales bacterium]|nr:hypothetical protein [Oligoflexales bacterium]
MLRSKFFSIMTAVSVLASQAAFAETSKKARKNDVAESYLLSDSGDLFRMVKGNKCQITNNVESFKVSQHPNDLAMIYFKKAGDLYMLRNAADLSGKCPKAEKKVLLKSVKKYSIIPNTKSIIVNIAQSTSGLLKAWGNEKEIVSYSNVREYKVNPTFGKKGDANADTLAFIMGNNRESYSINGRVEAKPEKVVGKALIKIIATLFNIAFDSFEPELVVANKPYYDAGAMVQRIHDAHSWSKLDVLKKELKFFGVLSVGTIKDILGEFSYDKMSALEYMVNEGKVPQLSGDDVVGILSKFDSFNKKDAIKKIKNQIKSINGQELVNIIDHMGFF